MTLTNEELKQASTSLLEAEMQATNDYLVRLGNVLQERAEEKTAKKIAATDRINETMSAVRNTIFYLNKTFDLASTYSVYNADKYRKYLLLIELKDRLNAAFYAAVNAE